MIRYTLYCRILYCTTTYTVHVHYSIVCCRAFFILSRHFHVAPAKNGAEDSKTAATCTAVQYILHTLVQ